MHGALLESFPDVEAAAPHGLDGLLAWHLEARGETLDATTREHLAVEAIRQRWLAAALREALAALRPLRVVALKGPLLAERYWPSPELRRGTDLDLLVALDDAERAIAALAGAGWHLERGPRERYLRAHHYHLELERPGAPLVELHIRLLALFGTAVPSEPFLDRARPFASKTAGDALVLDPEDEVLYLLVHAAGHRFERLSWLHDVRLLLERERVDWDRLASRARALGLESALRCGVDALARVGVAPGGPGLAGPRATLVASLDRPGRLAALLHGAALADRPGAAIGFLAHHFKRIAKRRVQRHAAWLVPEEWSG